MNRRLRDHMDKEKEWQAKSAYWLLKATWFGSNQHPVYGEKDNVMYLESPGNTKCYDIV